MKNFSERVWLACAKIPKGKVSTYASIDKAIGSSGAARAVGNALNKNPDILRTPCHRVVRSDGFVGGYAYGAKKKIALLNKEGVLISAVGKINLKKFLFKF